MKRFNSTTCLINIAATFIVVSLTTGATIHEKGQHVNTPQVKMQKLPENVAKLVDPTRPPDALISPEKSISATGPLQLSAIFFYKDYQKAIIDGQLVEPGDSIGEYTIINIHRDTVELIGAEGKELTLNLAPAIKVLRKDEGK